MDRAALYVRVSTDDQTEFSPDAQKKALLDYASRNNILIDSEHIYIDEGFSGRKAEKRPSFMRMIGIAKTKPKPFDIILVHKFDRFARNREDSVVYKSLLKKECNVRVISITEHLEDDKFSIILESMLEAMAEYYSLNLSEEVLKGMTEKARRGGLQSKASFGYIVENNKLIPHPEESKIIQWIFDSFLSGVGMFPIARKLNEMGIKTKLGHNFENRTVKYILQNETYIGTTIWCPGRKNSRKENANEIKITDTHEGIIDKAVFKQVQEKLRQLQAVYKPKQRPLQEHKHWLSGLMRCSACGGSMVRQKIHAYLGFQCRNYQGGKCKVSHRVDQGELALLVLTALDQFIQIPGNYRVNKVRAIPDLEAKKMQKQLDKIEDKLYRAKQAYINGIDSLEEYKQNKDVILHEQETLQAKIKHLEKEERACTNEDFAEKLKIVKDLLASDAPMLEKQKSIRSVVDKIIYNKPEKTLEMHYIFVV